LGEGVSHGLSHWLAPILPMAENHSEISHSTEFALLGVAVIVFVCAFLYTRFVYVTKKQVPEADDLTPNTGKLLSNKFYVDELYQAIVVTPLEWLSQLTDTLVDSKVLAGFISGISIVLQKVSGLNKKIQNGNIEYYLTFMVIALALFLGFNLLF